MSVGNSVKKIAAEFSVGLKMYKFMGGFKPNRAAAILGTSNCKDMLHSNQQLDPIVRNQTEKFCFILPKLDVAIRKSIIEPDKGIKINFELPIRNSAVTALDLPLHTDKEIKEPGIVISKKAIYMIRVRRRKMRKHKRKKFLKKFKSLLFKKLINKRMEKEADFKASLRGVLGEKENFSAEKYMEDVLAKAHWERPVTKVKGRLAPKWLIKEHLAEMEERRILEERIKECSK